MSEIKPALSQEEWGTVFDLFAEVGCPERHAFAARALHRQPFGFTWEDVEMLRDLANLSEWEIQSLQPWKGDLTDLADRIAALLPPREP